MRYEILDAQTGKVLDSDAAPTMFMLADWSGRTGLAVKRGAGWHAANYPGFEVKPGETVVRVRVREVR